MVKVFTIRIANSSQRTRIKRCMCQSLDSEKTTFSINSQRKKVKTSYSSNMCGVIVSIILSASGTLLSIYQLILQQTNSVVTRVAAVARALYVARAVRALLIVRRCPLIPI